VTRSPALKAGKSVLKYSDAMLLTIEFMGFNPNWAAKIRIISFDTMNFCKFPLQAGILTM
jgi:hypothetical protein